MSTDPLDTELNALKERALAGDIGGMRGSYQRGELQWLRSRMTPERYAHLGLSLEDGDLESVRSDLATVSPPNIVTSAYPDLVRRSMFLQSQRNGLIAGTIIAALALLGLIGFLVLRNDDNVSDTTVAMTSIAETVPPDTLIPATLPPDTILPAINTLDTNVPVTVASPVTIASPVASAAPPSTKAAQTPVQTPSPPLTTPTPSSAPPVTAAGTNKSDVLTTAARSSTFGPFLAMIDAAGLREEIQTLNPSTVLAPTESAFSSLSAEVQAGLKSSANKATLARIVRYNVIPQTITLRQFTTADLKSLEGNTLSVVVGNNKVVINDATVTGADVLTTTGVLHAIDKLLIPPGVSLNALVPKPVAAATTPLQTTPPQTAPPQTTPPQTTPPQTAPLRTQPPATPAPVTQPAATSAPAAATQALLAVSTTALASTTTKVP